MSKIKVTKQCTITLDELNKYLSLYNKIVIVIKSFEITEQAFLQISADYHRISERELLEKFKNLSPYMNTENLHTDNKLSIRLDEFFKSLGILFEKLETCFDNNSKVKDIHYERDHLQEDSADDKILVIDASRYKLIVTAIESLKSKMNEYIMILSTEININASLIINLFNQNREIHCNDLLKLIDKNKELEHREEFSRFYKFSKHLFGAQYEYRSDSKISDHKENTSVDSKLLTLESVITGLTTEQVTGAIANGE